MVHASNAERLSALFFRFTPEDTKREIIERLEKVRDMGIWSVIASYHDKSQIAACFNDRYYAALEALAQACLALGMSFWIEDYSPFPTGSANGEYRKPEYAHLNKLFIDERHMDIRGPVKNAVIRIDALQNVVYGKALHRFSKVDIASRERLCVVAYRLKEHACAAYQTVLIGNTAIELNSCIQNGYLKWNVPEGYWRVFVVFTTRESSGRPFYMNLLDKESVALEISSVHAPIYERLKEYTGKCWNGFFYDEPEIGNSGGERVFDFFMLPGRRTIRQTDVDVYPWSAEMPAELAKRDADWQIKLPYLWYSAASEHRQTRLNYMDAVTSLVGRNYSEQVYAYCREKGVGYIGHVLEDEGSHARLGCGAGHYFRQQYYQDEAGIDVIAGQILPGRDGASSWYGIANADGEFYHYGLAKLASSEARINPLKRNRSACETFAMYGQQGFKDMKYLIDHLLINGINRILFGDLRTYDYPIRYVKALTDYTDRMCSLLRKSTPVIKAAILYHAEAEWQDGDSAQGFHVPAAELARNQISYDVIPADVFAFPEKYNADFTDGLTINANKYEALIIPACKQLSPSAEQLVRRVMAAGLNVYFTDCVCDNFSSENYAATPLEALADAVLNGINTDILVESDAKMWLRYAHILSGGDSVYLLHNESPNGSAEFDIVLNANGTVIQQDASSSLKWIPKQQKTADGKTKLSLRLDRYEMTMLYERASDCPDALEIADSRPLDARLTVDMPDGASFIESDERINVDAHCKLVYAAKWRQGEHLPAFISLGEVSDCCSLTLNGVELGARIAAPYVFDVRGTIREGENNMLIEVYTSAANRENDASIFGVPLKSLTAYPYMCVESAGVRGVVTLHYAGVRTPPDD